MLLIVLIILLLFLFPVFAPVAAIGGLVAYSGGQDGLQPTALQKHVAREYPKYKIKTLPSFRDFCFPDKFTVQNQQAFLGDYVSHGATKEMLVFHGIGSGKTGVAIQIMARYANRKDRPLILLPASLIPGVYAEMRMASTGVTIVEDSERKALEVDPRNAAVLGEIKARIDKTYNLMSYNKFQTDWTKIDAPCLVIDEVQNVNCAHGAFYTAIYEWIKAHPRATIIAMSGTPLFDVKTELVSLARLLRINAPCSITPADVGRLFAGKVSYFRGAPSYVFPEVTLKIKRVPMSRFQAKWYTSNVHAEESRVGLRMIQKTDSFYCVSRQVANIAFPNGLTGSAGLAQLTKAVILGNLQTYSCKMAHLVKKLQRGGLSFVYSAFNGPGGVQSITKILRAQGWKDYKKHGAGPRRYAIWSGEQSQQDKDNIRSEFNGTANDHGGKIQIVVGSPAIKEGVSLARVRRAYVMEFYWNHSRMAQIYGRVSRFCSHKSLPVADRTVDIIVYAAVNPFVGKKRKMVDGVNYHDPHYSIDLYMKDMADIKRKENEPYVKALQDCAVDRLLFEKANEE